ncbi:MULTISPECIES: hypothetical protein [unclassified Undibacterium]|uniref:hypothetical protein n=1 Tax=unclassified Undibacterium TaxID=2630295 RepID=UPI002AC9D610|nr:MULTISPECIES: hypothetical protein [unclassified Undibacterium]MEB0140888.1 hypothetical protein [Undibacterium sp. CCC2.1]MEB0173857.1 hypothetical protein [Undibacterium sp. CCC1.1]MEB0177857.1 hypothetical protein [Undibacterium sp. CCC3.4]MEB0217078.1 hypothetical protein [Undibacterium sp. 5I2]WPX45504.1 hypothetical protein RHM61_09930 [Undibacterium sp. CCC3.4]
MQTTLYVAITNGLRTLLRIRRKRALLPIQEKPAFGSTLIRERLQMQLFTAIDHEQWEWLAAQGWRILSMHNNRRRYYCVPREITHDLLQAPPERRESAHRQLLQYRYLSKHLRQTVFK